jgi:hypothetical protein
MGRDSNLMIKMTRMMIRVRVIWVFRTRMPSVCCFRNLSCHNPNPTTHYYPYTATLCYLFYIASIIGNREGD